MESLLVGGGESGALMRAIDWSSHPLGPVEKWPQSLRTLVRTMLSTTFAMRVLWGPDLIMLYNDGYRPVLGASKHPRAMGTPARDVFPELWSVVGPLFARAYAGEAIALEDGILPLDRNGYLEECYFTLSYSPIHGDDGAVAGVLGIVHEVTERVLSSRRLGTLRELASAAAKATTAESACVKAASTLSGNLADVPFAALYLLDDDGETVRLVATSGLERGPAIPDRIPVTSNSSEGWPIARAIASHRAEVVDDVKARFGALRAGPYPEPIESAVMMTLARPGLERAYGVFIAGINPRRAVDDAYHAFFELTSEHIVTAISNARALEQERRRAEDLAALDREKTAFFNNVSHEFRTPLTLMLGPLTDAMARPERALVGEQLSAAYRNAQRLLKLVNSLLEFARIEAGRTRAAFQETDLSALTLEIASAFDSLAARAGLKLQVDCTLREHAFVDREMWEKIVLNLLSNAFKFTFEGTIRVALAAADGGVELSVSDTGAGVPAEEVPRLFQRFHRVEGTRARTHEGTGIGLALVQELVKLHGGTITVESRLGHGTTFRVRIPLGSSHLQPDQIVDTQRSPAPGYAAFLEEASLWVGGTSSGSRDVIATPDDEPTTTPNAARILVVDDNADMRRYIRSVFGTEFSVDVAPDGVVALEKLRASLPDLVVSDVMMPNLDGMGLLRAIREDPRLHALPVILLSARAGEESLLGGLDARADDYVTKPFSARELRARARTHIELGRLRSAIEETKRVVLEEEKTRLEGFLAQAPVGICILRGTNHVYELANPPYLELIGGRDVLGKPIDEALPETAPVVRPILDRVLQTGEPFFGKEFRVPIARGGVVQALYFNFVYQRLVDLAGRADGILVVASEVTEQVRARLVAEQLSQALAASNRELDQFAYVASHDLKAPLRGIANLSSWIEEGLAGKMDDETKQHMDMLRGRVARLEALIDGILSYSRAGRVQAGAERIDVGALLREIRDLLDAPRANIVLGADMPVLHAERTPLQQVFLNLINNALKHAERPDPTVEVTWSEDGDFHHFRVRDNGPGIAPEFQERIWTMFTTLKARDEVEGTGIGLSVVKKVVETRGGKVSVESAAGQGATFHVLWPKTAAS